ncbi:YceD family protein [Chlorobium phaeovibrioides]|uniref:DUF177 domain-containing protein n=1 Tax=Chlorobium phaeovibrioides TaxID=1094 RepID=A0ABW9UPV2_CHLPH|nr:YceD family protein [Chlorobium phaeovibrioides]MWV53471.1 DUF177 domain-containing protein [Chlorobium phaeovibrioides]
MQTGNALIEIRTAAITEGACVFDFTCRAEDFNDPKLAESGFTDEIRVRAVTQKNGSELMLTLTTDATGEIPCDICLAPVKVSMSGSWRMYCNTDGCSRDEEDEETRRDEYRQLDRTAVGIDLTEDVRETLLLSVPMKVTCTANPDCRLYTGGEKEEKEEKNSTSPWHESLAKLKQNYR